MSTLCIYTEKYPRALERFFPPDDEAVFERGSLGGGKYICMYNRNNMHSRLLSLMEYILLSDNPAISDSEKVFDGVAELVFRPTRGQLNAQLEEFLKESPMINIDGYVNFRLNEYSGHINAILYSIVKKNLYKL